MDAVRDWLTVRPNASHPYLFITDPRRRLVDIGLNRLLSTAKCLADLRDHVIRPHAFRHAAATRLPWNGAERRSI
jgi:site-specific recombinase XerD